jgi:hypothetical protein
MKNNVLTLTAILIVAVLLAACAPEPTSADKQRDMQAKITDEGVSKVGMPNTKNFREAKIMKMIQELCDKEVVTYTYAENLVPTVKSCTTLKPGCTGLGGKFTFVGESVGFPIPYATQFTAPESMQTYNIENRKGGERHYGAARLPQADPNGLYKPASAEATWVLMKDPNSDKVAPVYMEPKLACYPYKLPLD